MSLKKIICRVENFHFYSIMIDEYIDISVIGHFVVFATNIAKCVLMIV